LNGLNRRSFIARVAAAGAAGSGFSLLPSIARAETETLGALAQSKGILFGSWVRGASLDRDRKLTEIVARECKIVTSAVEVFWDTHSHRPGEMDFAQADAMVSWCRAHGIAVQGNNLLWYKRVPVWVKQMTDLKAARKAITDHITETCRHFAGKIHSWDVVNEALRPKDRRPDGLRVPVLVERFGPEFLDWSFAAARAADPSALLVYNEANFEYEMPDQLARRKAMLGLIDRWKAKNVPVDAIGMQSHLRIEWQSKFDETAYAKFLQEVSDRGLQIIISELDVVDRGAPGDIHARDEAVAATYKRFLDVALANRKVTGVITWGLWDTDSWITRGYETSFARPDGLKPRPLLYDDDYRPKAAYGAIADAFRAAPVRA